METQITRIGVVEDEILDGEFENLIQQIPHKNDVVLKSTIKYKVENYVELRSIDLSTATLGDLADFVGTITKDLITLGIFKDG